MKLKIITSCCLLLLAGMARAQWAVFDWSNLTQGIVNSSNEMAQTSMTAENMLANWKETVKIYEQSKAYYDKLRGVTETVKSVRKVKQCILMVGEISEIYVKNYDRMLSDPHFTSGELSSIAFGYSRLLEESTASLIDLQQIVTPGEMSMTDKDRLDLIDRVYRELTRYRRLTDYYTRKNISVAMLRAEETNDVQRAIALYGTDADRYW